MNVKQDTKYRCKDIESGCKSRRQSYSEFCEEVNCEQNQQKPISSKRSYSGALEERIRASIFERRIPQGYVTERDYLLDESSGDEAEAKEREIENAQVEAFENSSEEENDGQQYEVCSQYETSSEEETSETFEKESSCSGTEDSSYDQSVDVQTASGDSDSESCE